MHISTVFVGPFFLRSVLSLILPLQERTCGVEEPSEELLRMHSHLRQAERTDPTLFNATTFREAFGTPPNGQVHPVLVGKRAGYSYTIPTWFHIVSSTAASNPSNPKYVTDMMLQNQFAYIQQQYSNSSIYFTRQGVTRVTNDNWATGADDVGMKAALRQGSYSTLNVFFQSDLQTQGADPSASATLLGFCSVPIEGVTDATPRSEYVTDGCNILSGTMPGGSVSAYNMGGTAVHEIGHWNGLLHPFQDQTCDPNDPGDYIADTPQESAPTSGCPEGKDSCATGYNPNDPKAIHTASGYAGPDPIHNFMDYSMDSCYQGFTSGQAARMWNIFPAFRQNR